MKRSRNGSHSIKSNETLFSIVESLKEMDGAGVTELAQRLDLAKSTVHKHLVSLEERRYVEKRGDKYYLGLQFLNDGVYVRNQYRIYKLARERIDELASTTGESVWLTVHENGKGFILHGVGDTGSFSFDSLFGHWKPLHSSSTGKAILAHLPQQRVENIIDYHGLPAETEKTITDREELFSVFETIRERGYAKNFGEYFRGLHSVAVPVLVDERPIGAISISGAANRITQERIESDLINPLRETVEDLELQMFYG